MINIILHECLEEMKIYSPRKMILPSAFAQGNMIFLRGINHGYNKCIICFKLMNMDTCMLKTIPGRFIQDE